MPQEKQTTAVSQLIERLKLLDEKFDDPGTKTAINIATSLLPIERQQIEDAYNQGFARQGWSISTKEASDYFESIFTQ